MAYVTITIESEGDAVNVSLSKFTKDFIERMKLRLDYDSLSSSKNYIEKTATLLTISCVNEIVRLTDDIAKINHDKVTSVNRK